MNTVFLPTDKTGQIVTRFPQSSSLFKKYKIDFCCGGNRPFGEVAREKGLNADEILQEINELFAKVSAENQQEKDWMKASYEEIIDTIVNRYHAYLNQHLPELSQYVTKIMRVHGPEHPELVTLHGLFHELKTELEQHTMKEEQQIFPLILRYQQEPSEELLRQVKEAIDLLENEHDQAGRKLEKMREITMDHTLPEGACMTYQLAFKKLIELEDDTFMHVHLENNILFPRILNEVVLT